VVIEVNETLKVIWKYQFNPLPLYHHQNENIMNLSSTTLVARLYRWFYNQDKMPSNLCPYFWKLVLMWILIIPLSLLSFVGLFITRFDKTTWGERIALSVGVYIILIAIIHMIFVVVWLFVPIDLSIKPYGQIFFVGVGCWLLIIVIGVMEGVKRFQEYQRMKKYETIDDDVNLRVKEPKEPKPSIIITFIKAKYNKHCPQIKWD
jgi:hypothetical protein